MTLNHDELTEALTEALKTVDRPCTTFCRSGISVEDERYHVYHNGTGARDSDEQRVYAPGVLGLSKDGLTAKLRPWIEGLHRGEKSDLNATLTVDTRGPAGVGWPWHPTRGGAAVHVD